MTNSITPQQRAINAAGNQRSLAAAVDMVDADIAFAGRPIGSNETAFNDVPVIVPGGGSASYVENDPPVAVAPNLTLTDDNPTLPSATVRFASAYYPEDVLAFVNDDAAVFGNITATYDPALGMLVLTSAGATATVAQFQAALRAVTYTNTSDAPVTATRILDFNVQDGTTSIYANVRSVTVASVNDAPSGTDKIVSLLPSGSHTFSEADFGFSDVDGNNFSAVVFTTLPLSGSLTFFGSPLVQGMAIARVDLGNVVFTPAPGSFGAGYASFTFQVRDNGGLANGGQNTDQSPNTFTFDAPNAAPVVTTTGGSTAFVEGSNVASTPVAVDSALTLTDDGTTLLSATVSIGTGFNAAQDVLAFVNSDATAFGNIAASYNAATGVLTLSSAGATATVAQFQAALRAVTYTNSSDAPTTATRTISFSANDGEFDSALATRNVTVAASPDAPIGADVTGTVAEDGVYVFSLADFPFSDPDGDNFYSIYITSQPTAGKWYFDPGGPNGGNREDLGPWGTGFGVFASDIAAGKLFFIPDADANGAAYASFQYRLWSDNHASGQYQSAVHTFTLNVTPVNDAPVITNLDGDIATQTEGVGGTPFTDVGRNAVLTDDSADFAGGRLTLSVTNYNGVDSIGIFGDSTVTVDAGRNVSVGGVVIGVASGGQYAVPRGDTLTIDFNANATPALVQTLVRNLFVRDPRIEPEGGTREISLTLTDGDGDSATYTTQLVVTAINDEPGGADKTITINEDVGHSFAAADFGFVDNFNDGDGGISEGQALEAVIITTLPTAGSLTLDGVGVSVGQRVEAADLGKLVFTPAANANGNTYASFTFQVVDNGGTANGGQDTDQSPNTITFDVTPVNDAPTATGYDDVTYTEGDNFVQLDTGFDLVLTDVDSTDFDGGTFTISVTGNKVAGEDSIIFLSGGTSFLSIAGGVISYHGVAFATVSPSGVGLDRVVTFNANATLEAVQTLMRNVAYRNVNTENPSIEPRTISYTLTDGDGGTLNLTSTIDVVGVSDAPTGTDKSFTIQEDGSHVFSLADFGFSDVDNDDFAGVIILAPSAGALYLSGVRILSGVSVISAAQIESGLLSYAPAANANGDAYARIIFTVQDDGSGENGGQTTATSENIFTFNVTPVNDAPVIGNLQGDTVTFTEGVNDVNIDAGALLTVTDIDSANFDGATLTVRVANKVATEDQIFFGAGNDPSQSGYQSLAGNLYFDSILIGTINAAGVGVDRTVTFNANATAEIVQGFMRGIYYYNVNQASPSTDQRTMEITLTDGDGGSTTVTSFVNVVAVNDPSFVSTSFGQTGYTENGTAVIVDANVNVSDVDDTTLSMADVVIDDYQAGTDFLALSATSGIGDIVAVFNAATGTLELTSPSGTATLSEWRTALRSVTFESTSDAPGTSRSIGFYANDGEDWGFGSSKTVTITNLNDPVSSTLPGGTQNGVEDSDLIFSTANGNAIVVADPDQTAITVTLTVTNGVLTLSGVAGLSFSTGDGTGDATMTFTGTPAAINAALEGLRYRGDLNYNGTDSLAINVSDGITSSSGSIAIALAADNVIDGDAGDNTLDGTTQADYFDLSQGGNENLRGYEGNDGFYFGAAYDANDVIDGGAGDRDQIGLQGDYANGVNLGSLIDVEQVVLLPGNDARFGGQSLVNYSYNIIADAGTIVGNSNKLTIQANMLRVGESLTFDGSASSIDFLVYAGFGIDVLTGGSGNDGFFFGDGRFGEDDIVNGGAGNMDQLGLQGDYAGANAITFGATQLSGLEFIVLLSASDNRFGSIGGVVNYDLTMDDGNVVAGDTIVISATTLKLGENLVFDGSAETDGRFEIYSGDGNDVIIGGAGDDLIFGGGAGDTLYGGAGNDIFAYRSVTDSNSTERDGIQDFTLGDRIDLSRIDANINLDGKQDFVFVGTSAFSGTAGELRYHNVGGPIWQISGDVNGDGVSDLEIIVVITDGRSLTVDDFIGVNTPALMAGPEKAAADIVLFADDAAGPDTLMLADGIGDLLLDPLLSAGATDGQGPGALVRAGLSDGQPIDPGSLPDLVFIGTDYDVAVASSSSDLLL